MDTISTGALFRQGGSNGGTTWKERHSVDFIVNGVSLFRALDAGKFDMCGRFSAETRDWNHESARTFLLERASGDGLEGGRVMLFVCSECSDLACGAITCKIRRDRDTYVWESFAYENGYDPEMTDLASYSHIGPFHFHAEMYRKAISEAESTKPAASPNGGPAEALGNSGDGGGPPSVS
jgi:hypothetical protein